VLRGSNIAPYSYSNSSTHVACCQTKLKELEQQCRTCENELERMRLEHSRQNQLAIQKQGESRMNKSIFQFFAGAVAGVTARTAVAPIDRVKILIQTNSVVGNSKNYTNIFQTTRHIVQTEGIKNFWKGNGLNCLRVMPHTAIQFTAYDFYKNLLVPEDENINVRKRLLAGTFAGITAGSITHPIDVVRVRLQTQPGISTIPEAFRHVFAENGLRSFYKGYFPAMASLGPFIAINFATFDSVKTAVSKLYPDKVNTPLYVLGMGAVAGLVAQSVCYPLDTIRRRSEVFGKNYNSIPHAVSTIYKKEGVSGFYKGMPANAAKIIPNNFFRFFIFNSLVNWYDAQKKEDSL
jgi:solute carrier family 25 phosphate transporter 23/24/25/41